MVSGGEWAIQLPINAGRLTMTSLFGTVKPQKIMTTTELIDSAKDASRLFVRLAASADEIWVARKRG